MKIVIETKPCPFCGKDEGEPRDIGGGHYAVTCGNCGAQGPDDISQKDAAGQWNTRTVVNPARAKASKK